MSLPSAAARRVAGRIATSRAKTDAAAAAPALGSSPSPPLSSSRASDRRRRLFLTWNGATPSPTPWVTQGVLREGFASPYVGAHALSSSSAAAEAPVMDPPSPPIPVLRPNEVPSTEEGIQRSLTPVDVEREQAGVATFVTAGNSPNTPQRQLPPQPQELQPQPPRQELKQLKRERKSPHSKVLRVLSRKNSNPSFASIEAEMLRVDVVSAARACATDWAGRQRWGDVAELEANLGLYAERNFSRFPGAEDGGKVGSVEGGAAGSKYGESKKKGRSDTRESACNLYLNDWRRKAFPHQAVISDMIRAALSGNESENHKSAAVAAKEKRTVEDSVAELKASAELMSSAGKMTHSMVAASLEPSGSAPSEGVVTDGGLPCPHGMYRLVVSGWFLLWKRANALEIPEHYASPPIQDRKNGDSDKIGKEQSPHSDGDSGASDGEISTNQGELEDTGASLHHRVFGADPAEETYLWLRRWVAHQRIDGRSVGTKEKVRVIDEDSDQEGIVSADKQLVSAIVRVVAISNMDYADKKAAKLKRSAMDVFFPEETAGQ